MRSLEGVTMQSGSWEAPHTKEISVVVVVMWLRQCVVVAYGG